MKEKASAVHSIDPSKIPEELKTLSQWVAYRNIPNQSRTGKRRKVPFQPNGRPASVSDPNTWSSFEAVSKQLLSRSLNGPNDQIWPDGIGFVFSGAGLCGIDLDGAILDSGEVHPRAKELLDSIPGYKEVSPSGRGFHIITRGHPPWTGSRSGEFGVEVYTDKRFFTVTTRTCPDSLLTLPESVDLSALLNYGAGPSNKTDPVGGSLENLKSPDPAWTIARVREDLLKDLPDYSYPEWRQIGCALHHQFGGSDEGYELFDEYSQRGERYQGPEDTRKVWDSIRNAPGKNLVTIGTLIHLKKGIDAVEKIRLESLDITPDEPLLMKLKDAKRELKSIDWLVDGLIKTESLVMLGGAPAGGKTYVGLDIALSIATGKPWLGKYATKQGDVVLIACEGRDSVLRRTLAWEALKNDGKDVESAYISRAEIIVGTSPDAANSTEALARFIDTQGIKPKLILIDTMNFTLGHCKENDSNLMTDYFMTLSRNLIRRYKTAVVLVHHTNKEGADIRGSTVIRGALDALFFVKQKDGQFVFYSDKHKDRDKHEIGTSYLDPKTVEVTLADGKKEANIALFLAEKRSEQVLSPGQQDLIDLMKDEVGLGGVMRKADLREKLAVGAGNWSRDYIKPLLDAGYLEELDKQKVRLLKMGDTPDDDFDV